MGWDRSLQELLSDHRQPWLTEVCRGLMVVGQSRISYLAFALVGVALAWRYRGWRLLLASAGGTLVAIWLAGVGKALVGRPRPAGHLTVIETGGSAMPSDIAAMTVAAVLPLAVLCWRAGTRTSRALAVLMALGTLVGGCATVYLGAHWVSDVLVGWALGLVIGAGATALAERLPRAPFAARRGSARRTP